MSVLNAVTVDLCRTRTHARREATFYPGDRPGEGTVVIRLWKGKRAGSKCETDHYEIQPDGRLAWLWLNVFDASQPDVYRVDLDPRAKHGCTCRGFLRGRSCKHFDTTRALTREGEL
jgi:hypothetical protein